VDSLFPLFEEGEQIAYFRNVTGVVRGKWYRIPTPIQITPGELDLNFHVDSSGERIFRATTESGNVTYRDPIKGNMGKFTLDLSESDKNSTIQFIEATLIVASPKGEQMYENKLEGVHFPQLGRVVLTTSTPNKLPSSQIPSNADSTVSLFFHI
jgi:hypothetical protein